MSTSGLGERGDVAKPATAFPTDTKTTTHAAQQKPSTVFRQIVENKPENRTLEPAAMHGIGKALGLTNFQIPQEYKDKIIKVAIKAIGVESASRESFIADQCKAHNVDLYSPIVANTADILESATRCMQLLPPEERDDQLMEQVISLFLHTPSHHVRTALLEEVNSLPQEKRAPLLRTTLPLCSTSTIGFQLKALFNQVDAIPEGQRDSVLTLAKALMKESTDNAIRRDLIEAIYQAPAEQRQSLATTAARLYSTSTDMTSCAAFITTLSRIPMAERTDAVIDTIFKLMQALNAIDLSRSEFKKFANAMQEIEPDKCAQLLLDAAPAIGEDTKISDAIAIINTLNSMTDRQRKRVSEALVALSQVYIELSSGSSKATFAAIMQLLPEDQVAENSARVRSLCEMVKYDANSLYDLLEALCSQTPDTRVLLLRQGQILGEKSPYDEHIEIIKAISEIPIPDRKQIGPLARQVGSETHRSAALRAVASLDPAERKEQVAFASTLWPETDDVNDKVDILQLVKQIPVEKWNELSKELIKTFLDLPPDSRKSLLTRKITPAEMQLFFTLHALESQIKKGEDEKVIWGSYSSLKDSGNFIEHLKEMMRSFPTLTAYLVEHYREEVAKDLEGLSLNMEALDTATRLALLALLTSENIHKTIREVPAVERQSWLDVQITFQQDISGTIPEVFHTIREKNLGPEHAHELGNIKPSLEEFLQMISLKTLASLAAVENEADTVIAFMEVFNDTQLAVVIPMLPKEKFIDYLKAQSIATHVRLLSYATNDQREHYVDRDLLAAPKLADWQGIQNDLNVQIAAFNSDPTKENYAKLQSDLTNVRASFFPVFSQHSSILNSFKTRMLQGKVQSPLDQKIEGYATAKLEQLQRVESALQALSKTISELKVPGVVEIPDEFIDPISGFLMQDPYTDGYNTLSRTTWDEILKAAKPKNPFNRQPITKIEPDAAMQKRIADWKENHLQEWNEAIERERQEREQAK